MKKQQKSPLCFILLGFDIVARLSFRTLAWKTDDPFCATVCLPGKFCLRQVLLRSTHATAVVDSPVLSRACGHIYTSHSFIPSGQRIILRYVGRLFERVNWSTWARFVRRLIGRDCCTGWSNGVAV